MVEEWLSRVMWKKLQLAIAIEKTTIKRMKQEYRAGRQYITRRGGTFGEEYRDRRM